MSRKSRGQRAEDRGQTGKMPLVWAEVDLAAIRHNLRMIRSLVRASATNIMAIVKADAYGHGMAAVARELRASGVTHFGVATIDEARQLHRGVRGATILVLGSFHPTHVADYLKYRIRPTVSSLEDLLVLEETIPAGRKLAVHVKIDTGMGRLGIWHEAALPFLLRARLSRKIVVEGLYTHLSSTDEAQEGFTRLQMHRFETLADKLRPLGILPKVLHAANSLGLVRYRQTHLNQVRPGILLYGLNPWTGRDLPRRFEPVMALKARITFLRQVEPGRSISYSRTYEAGHSTRIAVLPVGYSHGYRVGLSNRAQVIVRGRLCPVVGRVTMDQTLIDVGGVPGVKRWDVATLIGREGSARVSAEDLANYLNTIPYEIVCGIHSRIPRVYKGLR